MKKCIWCLKDESSVSFLKLAHTIPQSLGGTNICDNVCDICNKYFGDRTSNAVAPEVALKEVLNFSKFYLLSNISHKKVNRKRYKSTFFKVDFTNYNYELKFSYKLNIGFQRMLAIQFKKGIYKVFLEERERQIGDACDDRFNFIREFARYDLLEQPVFYQIPSFPAIMFSTSDIEYPTIRFTEYSEQMDNEYRIFSYMLCGHNFVIPTSLVTKFRIKDYEKRLIRDKHPFGQKLKPIEVLEDIDYAFKFLQQYK